MPEFAIAIPHLNQARFLSTALESLRHQAVPLCAAFMDGGSSDHFKTVLEQYRDVLSFVDYGPDNGQAQAIRKGLEASSGDILGWLNADDYYFPGSLQRVSEVFSTHPEVDVVYGDAVHVEPSGLFLSHFHGIEDFNLSRLFKSCYICQPACFVRRSAYEDVGGIDTSLVYTMDWDLWCRLALGGKTFMRIQEPIAAVRYYPGTKTLSGSRKRYLEIWRIQKRYGGYRIPTAWPGFYWFDLWNKERKRAWELAVFYMLQVARVLKKKTAGRTDDRHQGFMKWDRRVTGTGRILFPWYGEESKAYIVLRIRPAEGRFLVSVAGEDSKYHDVGGGEIKVPVYLRRGSTVDLRLSCATSPSWELLCLSWGN